jgi:hypothetical protein
VIGRAAAALALVALASCAAPPPQDTLCQAVQPIYPPEEELTVLRASAPWTEERIARQNAVIRSLCPQKVGG